MDAPQYDLQSNEAHKLKKQIEFYFSNSNYPRDKFLRGVAAQNNGCVPIPVLITFNRVKSITNDVSYITAVLGTSDLLEVNDGMVKRKIPVPEKDTSTDRSIYVKGFPTNIIPEVTIEAVTELFSKFGDVLAIRLRRHKNKDFKGSAYIEYKTEEEAKKALEITGLRWNEESAPFIIYTKEKHLSEKKEQLKDKKIKMEQSGNIIKDEKSENPEDSIKSEKTEIPAKSEKSENFLKVEKKRSRL